jgi:hypothetical protein
MAMGTKGELVNVNICASIWGPLSEMGSARCVPVKSQCEERLSESQQGNRSIHLKTWDPLFTWASTAVRKMAASRPSKYRRTIGLPTPETSRCLTAEPKTLKSLVLPQGGFGDLHAITRDDVVAED